MFFIPDFRMKSGICNPLRGMIVLRLTVFNFNLQLALNHFIPIFGFEPAFVPP